MRDQTFEALLESIASKTPTPGGGAVTAGVGAISAALASMVVAYTTGKKAFEAHAPELGRAAQTLIRARELMLELAAEDERAYGELNRLLKLPEDDPVRREELPAVSRAAIQAPMAVLGACIDLLRLFQRLVSITNSRLHSDLAIAAVLIEGVARATLWNVEVNLSLLASEEERAGVRAATHTMSAEGARLLPLIETACRG